MKQKMLSEWLKEQFGTKVYKLSLSSGCTCPNRDGTIGVGGCTFCSRGGSGEFASPYLPIAEQIERAKAKVDAKFPAGIAPQDRKYIAYFQSFTNTYGDPKRLKALYTEAISRPEICALSIGTRPDCLPEPMLKMLAELNRKKPVWVELGLQTVHEKTAERINRKYPLTVFDQAYQDLKSLGLTVILHLILGLPGESREEMLESVRYAAGLNPPPDGIKLAQLQILKSTALGEEYLRETFPVMTLEEYTDLIRECLEILPETTVIHRLTGDGPKRLLLAPSWSADKKRVINYLREKIGAFR